MKNITYLTDEIGQSSVIDVLKNIVDKLNYSLWTIRDTYTGSYISLDIISLIVNADLIIAYIVHKNPNLMYEIGLAHGSGKPVLLMHDKSVTMPFDLSGIKSINGPKDVDPAMLEFLLTEILKSDLANISTISLMRESNDINHQPKYTAVNIDYSQIERLSGVEKALLLEEWLIQLSTTINGWNIHSRESKLNQNHRVERYDIVVWNNLDDFELSQLGNPIVIEAKATHRLDDAFIHALVNKAILQGLKSVIIATTAIKTNRAQELVEAVFSGMNFFVIILDNNDLKQISNGVDFLKRIKSKLLDFKNVKE